MAGWLGLYYFRYEAINGLSTDAGTNVDINMVTGLVKKAVIAVRTKPTCLHDVRETLRE